MRVFVNASLSIELVNLQFDDVGSEKQICCLRSDPLVAKFPLKAAEPE